MVTLHAIRIVIILISVTIAQIACPPVKPEKEKAKTSSEKMEDIDMGLEYERYLKEVVSVLESDPDFQKKLATAKQEDIKTGVIADELKFVDHKVRTKLDELKRQELNRLRTLSMRQHELQNGYDRTAPVKFSNNHLDNANEHTFEVEDLKKLILTTHEDLQRADERRKDEYKHYELEKERARRDKLKEMDEMHRKEAEEQHRNQEEKHKQHEKLKHPGSRKQLEEVWEEQDKLPVEEFEPKTFFALHDMDGDGKWNQEEVNALFQKELDKMYDPKAPEDDMIERYEEMERMREHVYQETDRDRDGLISLDEFIHQTKKNEFNKDDGWEGLDEKPAFNEEEYMRYEAEQREIRRRQMEMHPDAYYPVPVHNAPTGYAPQGGQAHYAQQPPPHLQGQHPAAYAQQGLHPQQQQQQLYMQQQQMLNQHHGAQFAPPLHHNQVPQHQGQGGQGYPNQVPLQQGVQAPVYRGSPPQQMAPVQQIKHVEQVQVKHTGSHTEQVQQVQGQQAEANQQQPAQVQNHQQEQVQGNQQGQDSDAQAKQAHPANVIQQHVDVPPVVGSKNDV